MSGMSVRHSARTAAIVSASVPRSSLSSMSSAVGPSITEPCAVGMTITPWVRSFGMPVSTNGTRAPKSRSSSSHWPRRGPTVKSSVPSSRDTWSAPRPAELTTNRGRNRRRGVCTSVIIRPSLSAPVAGSSRKNRTPLSAASLAYATGSLTESITPSPGT